MEAKTDEEEGVGATDSIVFIARVAPSSRLSLRGLFLLLLAPIRHAHSFLTALQTLGKVPEETLIVFFLYWPQIPQISLPIWKLPISHFESAARFDRTKLGSPDRLDRATWFRSDRFIRPFCCFCAGASCPIETGSPDRLDRAWQNSSDRLCFSALLAFGPSFLFASTS